MKSFAVAIHMKSESGDEYLFSHLARSMDVQEVVDPVSELIGDEIAYIYEIKVVASSKHNGMIEYEKSVGNALDELIQRANDEENE